MRIVSTHLASQSNLAPAGALMSRDQAVSDDEDQEYLDTSRNEKVSSVFSDCTCPVKYLLTAIITTG
jgi:hypothetical protein